MLNNGRAKHDTGCSCCNTRRERRKATHSNKRKEERAWRRELDSR